MALSTPNMGLTAWDTLSDPYNHSQLAANFNAIDAHDHTTGKGVRIGTNAILDNAITTAKIADLAVTTAKLANGAVTSDKLEATFVHPLGQIMPWWRPNLLTDVPTGWVIPIGQTLNSSQHDFPGGGSIILPDLRNSFLLGADTSGTGTGTGTPPDIGASGGSHTANLAHSHTVNSHDHSVPSHSHTVDSHSHAVDSHTHNLRQHRHVHFFPIMANADWINAYVTTPDPRSTGHDPAWPVSDPYMSGNSDTWVEFYDQTAAATYATMREAPQPSNELAAMRRYVTYSTRPVDVDGIEVVDTDAASPGTSSASPGTNSVSLTTGTASPGTSSSLSSTDIRPKFTGVLFLMRVKS